MFLLVSTSMVSVASIFIPGSPFISGIINEEKEGGPFEIGSEMFKGETTVANRNFNEANIERDQASNVAHITMLMIGIIIARFGNYRYI